MSLPSSLDSLSLVKVSVERGVAVLSINRPEALNSINPAVVHQLHQVLEQAIASPEVRGLVIAGEGKSFVVGADIEFFLRNVIAGDIDRIVKFTAAGHALLHALDASPKPVVARVHGAAWGAGTELALACDLVVASPGASFSLPETGLGIYPGFGGTQRAPRKLGVGIAKWMIFTGKTLSAADATRIGLVDQIVPAEQLDETARSLAAGETTCPPRSPRPDEMLAIEEFFARAGAQELRLGTAETGGDAALARAMRLVAGKSPVALALAAQIIDQGTQRSLPEGLKLELDHLAEIFQTPDALAGLQARAKKRLG